MLLFVWGMKKQLTDLLRKNDLQAIYALAVERKRVLSLLTALTYHPDRQISDRAVTAFGPAALAVAVNDLEFVRNQLRRLLWLVNDESGGIGWRAPELMATVLSACPGMFDEFISPLVHLLNLEPEDAPRFRMSVLKAIDCLAAARPQAAQIAIPLLMQLDVEDTGVQNMIERCLRRLNK